MVYTLRFFLFKMQPFHNYSIFGSCIIHILYTGCAKIKKNYSGAKRVSKFVWITELRIKTRTRYFRSEIGQNVWCTKSSNFVTGDNVFRFKSYFEERLIRFSVVLTAFSTRGKYQNAKTNASSVHASTRTPANFSGTQSVRDTVTAFLWQVHAKCNRSGEVCSRGTHKDWKAPPSHCTLAVGA